MLLNYLFLKLQNYHVMVLINGCSWLVGVVVVGN